MPLQAEGSERSDPASAHEEGPRTRADSPTPVCVPVGPGWPLRLLFTLDVHAHAGCYVVALTQARGRHSRIQPTLPLVAWLRSLARSHARARGHTQENADRARSPEPREGSRVHRRGRLNHEIRGLLGARRLLPRNCRDCRRWIE